MRAATRMVRGFTLIELLISVALAGIVAVGVAGLVQRAIGSEAVVAEQNELLSDAQFALDRIVAVTSRSRRLLLPLADNPASNWPENIREQTVPASAPIGDSTFASAVLAVTLPADIDLDGDGIADADDDADGRIDEDLPNDAHHDFLPGIALVDDDGDGSVDEGSDWAEDDEDGVEDEDPLDGIDNDGDGSIDEDAGSDFNGDACPGICTVDDDGDGAIDDGSADDDDEDGNSFEDPYDPVVFYLDGNTLMERMPVPWNEDGISSPDGPVDGRDFVASPLASNVSRLRIERLPVSESTEQLVAITLELTGANGGVVSLDARVRIGGVL